MAPHRVGRYLEHPGDLANALALPSQYPDLHRSTSLAKISKLLAFEPTGFAYAAASSFC
jgi:hypothetical protein